MGKKIIILFIFIREAVCFMWEQMYVWLFALKYTNIGIKQQFTIAAWDFS